MQWNSKLRDESMTELTLVTPNVLVVDENAYFEANVTYNGDVAFDNATVVVEIYRYGSLIDSFELVEVTPGTYAGSANMNYSGVLDAKVVSYKTGYGYSSSDFYPLLVEMADHERNAPNGLMVLIALANIGIVVLFALRFAVFRNKD